MTAPGKYPDCVVALSRHMLWSDSLDEQEREHAPDLVVTARPGWCFGTEATPGTTHGYPFSDSMRPASSSPARMSVAVPASKSPVDWPI